MTYSSTGCASLQRCRAPAGSYSSAAACVSPSLSVHAGRLSPSVMPRCLPLPPCALSRRLRCLRHSEQQREENRRSGLGCQCVLGDVEERRHERRLRLEVAELLAGLEGAAKQGERDGEAAPGGDMRVDALRVCPFTSTIRRPAWRQLRWQQQRSLEEVWDCQQALHHHHHHQPGCRFHRRTCSLAGGREGLRLCSASPSMRAPSMASPPVAPSGSSPFSSLAWQMRRSRGRIERRTGAVAQRRRLRGKETSASFIHSVGDDGAGREILEEGGALFDTVQHHCEEGVLHHRGSCAEELLPLAHCVHILALFIQAEPALPDGLQRIPHSCLARGHPAVGEDEDEDGDDALACRRLLP